MAKRPQRKGRNSPPHKKAKKAAAEQSQEPPKPSQAVGPYQPSRLELLPNQRIFIHSGNVNFTRTSSRIRGRLHVSSLRQELSSDVLFAPGAAASCQALVRHRSLLLNTPYADAEHIFQYRASLYRIEAEAAL